jgi:hypothetical protein
MPGTRIGSIVLASTHDAGKWQLSLPQEDKLISAAIATILMKMLMGDKVAR